ncbi:superinfection immunity protein [Fimbriiglobus ruber]|uniref:Superinfection immunity protein n=1 Tax=Fimbriiglobus ruber TaxID=1908690 RepID=A0A225E108_9BACT|nr:superinfection immunity protein [Fimbriiglobus ruber]OWK42057.1 hypothetical protein FRUB_04135 [Fimbriiglobus ruber]
MDADTSLTTDLTLLASDPKLWLILTFYFLPTLLAAWNKSAALPLCFWVNLLAGWTLIGWIAAALLSLAPSKNDMAYRNRVRQAKDDFYLREAEKSLSTPPAP